MPLRLWLEEGGTAAEEQRVTSLRLVVSSDFSASTVRPLERREEKQTVVELPGGARAFETQRVAIAGVPLSDTRTAPRIDEDTKTATAFDPASVQMPSGNALCHWFNDNVVSALFPEKKDVAVVS